MKYRAESTHGFSHQQHHAIRLRKERTELQKAIDAAERQIRQLLDETIGDSLSVTAEEAVLLHRLTIYRERLKKVQQSLLRIRDGHFGLCLTCDGPIGEQRLTAMPSALYCIRCQHRYEQEQN